MNYIVIKHGFPDKWARATIRKVQDMMSLPAIIGISAGAAGVVAFSRKKQPQSLLKKIGVFFLAFIGTLVVMLAVNFAIFYAAPT
ncbi:hypothetical protein [Neorhizobium sp. DAR64862/K0K3]|uniref:hypothetical protein n=2 Tax=Rhizobium/Agrobacterium group TaxID=227290 RepID=UPI003D264D56